MRSLKVFSRLIPLVLALLGWPAPSNAYRMSQANSNGQATGRQVNVQYVTCNDRFGFEHWNSRTMSWYHNPAGQGAGKAAALQAALTTWTEVPDADYTLLYAGQTSAGASWDGQNTFVWGTTSTSDLCNGACHAVTVVYLGPGQVIQEADIVLNDTMTWKTDGTSAADCMQVAPGTWLDTQAIATHELGHSLGIGHTEGAWSTEPAASATMAAQTCSVAGRSLSADDMEALKCSEDRYPMNPSYEGYHEAVSCQATSGWAWNANRPRRPSYVEISDSSNAAYFQVVPANLYRSDLASAGKGDGVHAFAFSSPFASWLQDGGRHTIYARFSGTGGNLTWTARDVACRVQLFQGRWYPSQNLDNGGAVYTVGTQLRSSQNGTIKELWYYRAYGETGNSVIRLWNDSGGAPLGSVNVPDTCVGSPLYGGQWCGGTISPAPVPIQAGTLYRVGVDTHTRQSKSPCSGSDPSSLASPITKWPLTATGGLWSAGDTFPTTGSCSNFFVDVTFDM